MDIVVLAIASIVWGAVLVGAASVLQAATSLSGAARQTLWRVAAVLLVAPWIAAPIADLAGIGLPAPPPEPAPAIPVFEETVFVDTLPSAEPAEVVAPPAAAPAQPLPWQAILITVIMAGWAWRVVAAQVAARALKSIVAKSVEAGPGPARQSLEAWSRRLNLKRTPSLRIVAEGLSPFSFGMVRPVICLPEGLDRKLDREALDLVVGHECLHTARGDGWLRPVERLVADLVWFNPFAWRIRRELDVARELACDEAVLKHSQAHRAYAHTLRNVAGITAGLGATVPAASMSLAGSPRSLMLRVKRALAGARARPAWTALAGVGVFAIAGTLMACAQGVAAAPRVAVDKVDAGSKTLQNMLEAARAAQATGTNDLPLLEAMLEQALAAESADAASNIVRAKVPMRVLVAGKLDQNGNYVELEQTGDATASPRGCLLEAYHFTSLNVQAGRELKAGDVVGHGRPLVSPKRSCVGMLDGVNVSEEIMRREPGNGIPPRPVLRISGETRPVLDIPTQVTSGFGFVIDPFTGTTAFHEGIDLRGPTGTPIHAPVGGTVTFADDRGNLGKVVELELNESTRIRLAHLDEIRVELGVVVKPGDVVGTVGSTGRSTGPHLHLEYFQNGKSYDPARIENLIFSTSVEPQLPPRSQSGALSPALRLNGKTSPILKQGARVMATGGFGYRADPFTGKTVFHPGIDLAASLGAPILAPVDGVVAFAGVKGGWGRAVELKISDSEVLLFGHLGTTGVKNGAQVKAGDEIGTMGSTGRSTGPHLHLEYLRDGKNYDPRLVENLVLATSLEIEPQVPPPVPPTPPVPPSGVAPVVPPPAPVAPDILPADRSLIDLPPLPQQAPTPSRPAVPPTPPTPPLREIKAWYPARVTLAEAGRSNGFRVKFVQTAATTAQAGCDTDIDGLVELKVRSGQELKVGDVIGSGVYGKFSLGEQCQRTSAAVLDAAFPDRPAANERRFSNGTLSAIRRSGFDPSMPGREIRAWYPAKVMVADGSAETGYKVRLVQTRNTDAVSDCTVTLSNMQSLQAKLGQTLTEGDVIGTGAPDNMTFQVACRESTAATGRSPMLNAFPELRQPRSLQTRATPVSSGPIAIGSDGYGAGPIGAPFNARVVKVEKVGELFAVDIEATEKPLRRLDRLGEGCTARLVGLAEVSVAQGAIIMSGQTIGRQDAPDDFTVFCKSIRPAS